MAPTADRFVREVMDALGESGPAGLARALGYGPGGDKRVGRWLKGENEPDYEATMLMAERAGLLRLSSPARPADAPTPRPRPELDTAEVLQSMRVALNNQRQVLTALESLSGAVADLQAAVAVLSRNAEGPPGQQQSGQ